jgi:hypothetical protein
MGETSIKGNGLIFYDIIRQLDRIKKIYTHQALRSFSALYGEEAVTSG